MRRGVGSGRKPVTHTTAQRRPDLRDIKPRKKIPQVRHQYHPGMGTKAPGVDGEGVDELLGDDVGALPPPRVGHQDGIGTAQLPVERDGVRP